MSIKFEGRLSKDLEQFVSYKRALGYIYGTKEEERLRRLGRFAVGVRSRGLRDVVVAWISRPGRRSARTIQHEFSTARQFCLFLRQRDPTCFVPDRDMAPRWRRGERRLPHIYSKKEVLKILRATKKLRPPPWWGKAATTLVPATYRVLILILYCTGLRLGEALRLTISDLATKQRAFFIRRSKGKPRWVPFHRSLAREIETYLKLRTSILPATPESRLLIQPNGRAYDPNATSATVVRLLRRSGLKKAAGRVGPRPYDFRHTFAVTRLLHWYRAGVDVNAHLPWLSIYMGHDDLLGTEVYLRATGELMSIASNKFATRFRRRDES